jgi:signal transduction histidine kinase
MVPTEDFIPSKPISNPIQSCAERDQMLAIVCHDMKNPLCVIQLEAQMLLKVAEQHCMNLLSEEVKNQANRILKTTDRLKTLIVDLIDKNKSDQGLFTLHKMDCDLSELFEEVIEANRPLTREKNLSIQTFLPEKYCVYLDKNKIFQVLSNLFSNAIKFTPINGSIEVAIKKSGNVSIVSISDTGPGIKNSEIDFVFEKYWAGSCEGQSETGLGLYICKKIVEAHGGSIKAENVIGNGARFCFSLPQS